MVTANLVSAKYKIVKNVRARWTKQEFGAISTSNIDNFCWAVNHLGMENECARSLNLPRQRGEDMVQKWKWSPAINITKIWKDLMFTLFEEKVRAFQHPQRFWKICQF